MRCFEYRKLFSSMVPDSEDRECRSLVPGSDEAVDAELSVLAGGS